MALFDTLIAELSKHFNLGGRAAALVAETLRSMTSENIGGLGGFLDKFKHAGLSEVVASWLGQGPGQDLQPAQIEAVLGSGFLAGIAHRIGLDTSFLAAPVAFSLPRIVDLLTPAGEVPATLPSDARALLGAAPASTAGATTAAAPAPAKSPGARFWWFPALLALIAIAAYFAWQTPTGKMPQTAQPEVAPTPVAKTPAKLSITNTNGQVLYGGKVADETTRDQVIAALKQAFGADNLRGTLNIDPGTEAAAWLSKLTAALGELKVSGAEAIFEGKNIFVGGLPDSDLATLKERLASIFGADFSLASLVDRVSAAIASAREQTLAALAALKSDFSGPDLVNALNLAIINFETGSANVTADARALLERVAASMKAAPQTTVIEIAGHTDTTGDAAANQALSEQRAAAVRSILVQNGVPEMMLIAKGYGDTRPIASNDTPDGRFQNRRIEFIVLN